MRICRSSVLVELPVFVSTSAMRGWVCCIAMVLVMGTAVNFLSAKLVADPADGYSMPAVFKPKDFFSLCRLFFQPGNSIWLADNYKVAELNLTSVDKQQWVRWHFIKKNESVLAVLAYRYPSRIEPVGYSIEIFNRGDQPITVSGSGQSEAPDLQIIKPGEDRLVHIKGQPTLVVHGTKPELEYNIYLRDLSIYYPEAAGLSAIKIEAPKEFSAGKKMQVKLAIQGNIDKKVVDMEVRQEPWVVWRIRLSDDESNKLETNKECVLDREVPWYLSPGEITFGLVADGYRINGAEGSATVNNEHKPELANVERRLDHGQPTFFVNGKPFVWSGYATYNFYPGAVNEFFASEANLVHITCAAGRHFHNVGAPTWLGGDEYDFGEIEQMVTTALQANPDARLIMRLALGLPPFWYNEHPDSLVCVQSTDGRELVWYETESMVGTLTSEAWRKQQAVAVRKLIQYCASRPWASQLIGFNICCGMTEEWFAWASCDEIIKPVKYFGDYSVTNQQAFIKWCAARGYPYNRIPDAKIRNRADYDLFPDDADGRWAAAYNLFMNETTAETIKYFAAVVKDETRRRSLVGAFYGYVVLLTGEARQSDSGQLGLREVLESDDVDYLGGVPQHLLRRLCGDGYAQNATAGESVLAHGKQYMDDNDLFSWLHPLHWHTEYDAQDPRGAVIQMHRRWLATEAIHGNSYEWFSLASDWHHDEGVMEEFAKEARIHAESLNYDRTAIEEIAFVIDDNTFSWLTPTAKAQYTNQVLLGAFGRTGAPVGVWLLCDLGLLPERIKFVVVVNAGAPRTEDIDKLKKLIDLGGRTIMVIGVPGLVDAKTQQWNPAGLETLLGMPIRLDDGAKPARAALVETGQWLCPMQVNGRDQESIRPRAYLSGDGFMKYEDGKTAGAERPLANGGRLIWCGVPPYASEEWLRKQVAAAGVHCYAPAPCSVHASKDLVSITSVYFDDRNVELNWPQEVVITDMFDGWRGQGNIISCPFKHGQTRLFKVTKP
jgi:hypothetical protein